MTAIIIDGTAAAEQIRSEVKEQVAARVAAGVPAGIYFARLECDGHVAQRKLVRVN